MVIRWGRSASLVFACNMWVCLMCGALACCGWWLFCVYFHVGNDGNANTEGSYLYQPEFYWHYFTRLLLSLYWSYSVCNLCHFSTCAVNCQTFSACVFVYAAFKFSHSILYSCFVHFALKKTYFSSKQLCFSIFQFCLLSFFGVYTNYPCTYTVMPFICFCQIPCFAFYVQNITAFN
jgi:hypothetical protein